MFDRIAHKLTYANVMSTIAIFLVLAGGTVYAASKIGAGDIRKNAVRSKAIKDKQVKSQDLANLAVTSGKVNYASLGLIKARRMSVNTEPNTTVTPELLNVGDITLTTSCLEDGSNGHTALVTASGPDGVMSGVSGGDWSSTAGSFGANVLPSSAGTKVGNPNIGQTHILIELSVVTPTTAILVNLFVGINLNGEDCTFMVSGTRL